jgi:hypothetical protein
MKQPKILSVTSTEYCTPVFSVDCNGVKCENGCPLAKEANAEQVRAWLREQFADAGDSDLSKVKIGDWIFTIQNGWTKVLHILDNARYVIHAESGFYTIDGKYTFDDSCPSAWVRPPAYLNAPPKPKPKPVFKKGDRVLVWNVNAEAKERRIFSHYDSKRRFPYVCFKYGADEWSSRGLVDYWACCQKWEEE